MCKKLIFLILFMVVLSLAFSDIAGATEANLVGWWKFDETSGSTAQNSAVYSNGGWPAGSLDGTLNGTVAFTTAGYRNGAVDLDGVSGSFVSFPANNFGDLINELEECTFSIWVNFAGGAPWQRIWSFNTAVGNMFFLVAEAGTASGTMRIALKTGAGPWGNGEIDAGVLTTGQWHHVAVTVSKANTTLILYLDGEPVGSTTTLDPLNSVDQLGVTTNNWLGQSAWPDPLFNGYMDDFKIYNRVLTQPEIEKVADPEKASMPNPADGSTIGQVSLNLEWQAGIYAAAANGHHVYFGDNFDDVNDGTGGTDMGLQTPTSYPVSGLTSGETYYWRIDEVNGVDTWKGHVWSFTAQPVKAYNPSPPDDSNFIDPNADLSWSAGANAASHDIYFGTTYPPPFIQNQPVANTTYEPGTMDLDTPYYWRIDEVNGLDVETGDDWEFRTGPVQIDDPNLVGWWKFDDGTGTRAIDWSGYYRHGTLNNGGEWLEDGKFAGAIQFDGENDYISVPVGEVIGTLDECTIATWVDFAGGGAFQKIFNFGTATDNYMYLSPDEGTGLMYAAILVGGGTEATMSSYDSLSSGWHHVAMVLEAGNWVIYLDSEEFGFDNSPPWVLSDLGVTTNNWLGKSEWPNDPYFNGSMDDFRIYDYAMTQQQVRDIVTPLEAWLPEPANETEDVSRYPTLSWEPGIYAADVNGHELYFSSDFNDVNERNPAVKVTLTNPTYTIPTPPAPLESLGIYYWRVDEVNNAHPDVNWPGDIWTFTIRDKALIDNFETYESSDLEPTDSNDLRMTWIDGEWDFVAPGPGIPAEPGSSGGFVQLATDDNDAWDQDFGGAYEHYQPADTVRNGSDSMKFHFDNDGEVRWIFDLYYGYQDIDLIYDAPQYSEARAAVVDAGIIDAGEGQQSLKMLNDWSGYKVMSLSYYGDANNADMESTDKLFVTLADDEVDDVNAQVQYNDDVDSLSEEWWHDWYIPMNAFTTANGNLNMENIYRIHVGVGHRINRPSGGTGLIFIDDLQLYSTGICQSGTVAEDFSGDCEVDNADLDMMTSIWLNDVTTTPVIKIDASLLSAGAKTSIANQGSYSCNFVDFNDVNANDSPVVETVDGEQCITFDIDDVLISDANAPDSITGSGPFTAVYKVYNPEYDEHGSGDEEFFMWAKRLTTNRYAAVCIGSNPDFGAGAFWADGDIGYNQLPAAGQWHEIVMIYEGRADGTLYLWVDGHLDNFETKNLDLWPDCPMMLGGAYDGDPYVDAIPEGLIMNTNYKFTGSLAYLAVYDYAVPVWELEDWVIGDAIPANPINLYDSDSVINFKDLAVMGLKWMETPTLIGD